MSGKTNKIKGFTLLEMLVTMAISSLLTYFAWEGYLFFNRYYGSVYKKTTEYNTLVEFDNVLQRDLWNAGAAELDGDGLSISAGGKKTFYIFRKDFIVRKSLSSADTFKVSVLKFSGLLDKEPIVKGLIDKLSILILSEGKQLECFYDTHYSPADRLLFEQKILRDAR